MLLLRVVLELTSGSNVIAEVVAVKYVVLSIAENYVTYGELA
jgi:hypothetical protein